MALASVCLTILPQATPNLLGTLRQYPQITEIQPLDNYKIALVIEETADKLTGLLKVLADLPNVSALDLVFVNYEDDKDSNGHIPVPPEALE